MTSYTWTGLSLQEGARYSMRVGAVNHAGFLAAFETNGVVIDTSPPLVSFFLANNRMANCILIGYHFMLGMQAIPIFDHTHLRYLLITL